MGYFRACYICAKTSLSHFKRVFTIRFPFHFDTEFDDIDSFLGKTKLVVTINQNNHDHPLNFVMTDLSESFLSIPSHLRIGTFAKLLQLHDSVAMSIVDGDGDCVVETLTCKCDRYAAMFMCNGDEESAMKCQTCDAGKQVVLLVKKFKNIRDHDLKKEIDFKMVARVLFSLGVQYEFKQHIEIRKIPPHSSDRQSPAHHLLTVSVCVDYEKFLAEIRQKYSDHGDMPQNPVWSDEKSLWKVVESTSLKVKLNRDPDDPFSLELVSSPYDKGNFSDDQMIAYILGPNQLSDPRFFKHILQKWNGCPMYKTDWTGKRYFWDPDGPIEIVLAEMFCSEDDHVTEKINFHWLTRALEHMKKKYGAHPRVRFR